MINLLIYTLIGCAMYLIFKKEDQKHLYIERESDSVIEVIVGKFMFKEK